MSTIVKTRLLILDTGNTCHGLASRLDKAGFCVVRINDFADYMLFAAQFNPEIILVNSSDKLPNDVESFAQCTDTVVLQLCDDASKIRTHNNSLSQPMQSVLNTLIPLCQGYPFNKNN